MKKYTSKLFQFIGQTFSWNWVIFGFGGSVQRSFTQNIALKKTLQNAILYVFLNNLWEFLCRLFFKTRSTTNLRLSLNFFGSSFLVVRFSLYFIYSFEKKKKIVPSFSEKYMALTRGCVVKEKGNILAWLMLLLKFFKLISAPSQLESCCAEQRT